MPKGLTTKQRRLVKNLLDQVVAKNPGSLTRAALDAGYSPNTAHNLSRDVLGNPGVLDQFTQLLEEAGLTHEELSKLIAQGARAHVVVMHHGRMIAQETEAPDYQSRYRFIELVLKLQGLMKDKVEHSGTIQVDPVDRMVELWKQDKKHADEPS